MDRVAQAPGDLTPLDRMIRDRIAATGPIPVHEFMRLCLGHPEHGYYRRRLAIGRSGDFITAPEISQIFGELIGLWSAIVGQSIFKDGQPMLIEIGPGRGTLMADALRALKVVPGYLDRLALHFIEPSPTLAGIQRQTLACAPITPAWHEDFCSVPEGPAVIIANEVIDALPVHQLVRRSGGWRERMVALGPDGQLAFLIDPGAIQLVPPIVAPDSSLLEVRPDSEALVATIAQRARAHPTVTLIIDYGHAATGFGDTLQAVRGHRRADPLAAAGEADLSAQVDFEALARVARRHGLETDGPNPQAAFLGALGIVERAQALMRVAAPAQASAIETGVLRLIDPAGMGSRFKVLGLRPAGLGRLPGF
jgi:SAM-dependent MidA family methyltransferase